MPNHYPKGTVRDLLETEHVTDATRQILSKRLRAQPWQAQFFTVAEFALLQAICTRLIPQEDRQERIDIAGGIDKRLTQKDSDGWRYDTMPPDGDAYKLGLKRVDETAQFVFQQPFQQLSGDQQDDVLGRIQRMEAQGETWKTLPPNRFFEELLAEAASNYYSHPLAQEEIGYVGMADLPTWQRIGLNQLEEREPRETNEG